MRRGGLFELYHRGKTFIYKVVSFYLGFGLSGERQVELGDKGEGTRENRGWKGNLSEGESGSRN